MNKLTKIIAVVTVAMAAFAVLSVPAIMKADVEPRVMTMRVTAYSSSPDETDENPFITANGSYVYDGVIATNALPFGTRVQIPSLFGNKIFTVEDRMAKRFKETIDIWMTSKKAAIRFGVTHADIHILPDAPVVALAK